MSASSLCCLLRLLSSSDDDNGDKFGVTTVTGMKPGIPDWTNQDNYFVKEESENLKGGRHIYAVFDGHGQHGHKVSQFCREQLMDVLSLSGDSFPPTFDHLHQALVKSDIDVDSSGTTCTIVVIKEGIVELYNAGDSKAMIATKSTSAGLGFGFDATAISYDHSCDKEDEVERIVKSGGKVCSKSVTKEGSPTIEGPLRVWYRSTNIDNNHMIGLAMTRSLGDSGAHKVGVSHEPYEHSQKITSEDEFIILGSDGVWDVISVTEAAGVINEYIKSLPPIKRKTEWCPKEAAKIITLRARQKWQSANHIDDITCCVIKLTDNYGEPCFITK